MTGGLVSLTVLGVGMVVHSVSVLASARQEPVPFSVSTVATSTAPTGSSRPRVRTPVRTSTRALPQRPVNAGFVATRLRIADLHVDAPIVAVLSGQRTLIPPEDPSRVGWWIASALAGSAAGPTVIVGHIDSAASGPGALFDLDQVKPGQPIQLSNDTRTAYYRATSMRFYRKTDGLPESLFAPAGAARLVLVSCGGSFDSARHSYRSNVVVIATPTA